MSDTYRAEKFCIDIINSERIAIELNYYTFKRMIEIMRQIEEQ
jgi:hypothetical protein